LIERGVAVALVEYRFSGEALFPACLHDVKAAVRWLRQFGEHLGVNGEAIGVWGESAGGHLAAFIALNGNDERLDGTVGVTGCSSDVVAGVAWYPDTDFLALGPGSDRTGSPDPTSPEALLIGALPGIAARMPRLRVPSPTFTRAQRRSCWYTASRTASYRLNRAH
jgi:hypothetical protein